MGRISRLRNRTRGKDEGAQLVEFAILLPLLLLVLLGIVEFGWIFAQNLDVRHGAREGARLAAVNYPVGQLPSPPARTSGQTDTIVAEICDRMDTTSNVEVSMTSTGGVGDEATVTVEALADTLTGFLDWAISPSLTLSSTVTIRVEQFAGWANTANQACP